jgi:hypothetical protein
MTYVGNVGELVLLRSSCFTVNEEIYCYRRYTE